MAIPQFTLRQMVEAGVHFGHHARRWNPQMAPYIYGKKDNIHIIDLQKTYPMLYTALAAARDIAAQGGKVLFVGTKRQAQDIVKENAERCGQYYVNHRWLGGMLTNWKTVYKSISRLVKLNEMEEKNAYEGYTKKEMLNLKKEREKLASELSGIMNMGGQPDLLFVIDTPKEALAVKEAKSWAFRLSALPIPTPTRTTLTSRFRATTTPFAPFSSTANWFPAPFWTACRPKLRLRALRLKKPLTP